MIFAKSLTVTLKIELTFPHISKLQNKQKQQELKEQYFKAIIISVLIFFYFNKKNT